MTNVRYNTETLDSAIYSGKIAEHYTDVNSDIFLSEKGFKKLKEVLTELFGDYTHRVYDHNLKQRDEILTIDDLFYIVVDSSIRYDGNCIVTIYADTEETGYKIYERIKDYVYENDEDYIGFRTMTIGQMGITSYYERYTMKELEDVDEDYYEDIDINEMFKQFTEFDENILCLIGAPGIGKTKLSTLYMKYMLTHGQNDNIHGQNSNMLNSNINSIVREYVYSEVGNVIYVKDHNVLITPEFWHSELPSYSSNLVIFDDIDNIFGKRTSNITTHNDDARNIFISNFLSYVDGVKKNKTKFIITTNLDMSDIDTAMLRKGRMFDVLELKELSPERALKIWTKNGLKEKRFDKIFGGETTIKQCDLGSYIKKYTQTKVKVKSYLKDKNISKLDKFKQPKKMGV